MSGHTPGPWMRDGFSVTPYAPAGEKRRTICIAAPDVALSPKASMDRMRADARLIAAAPELLEALHEGRRAIGDHFAPNDCYATGPVTGDAFRDLVQCPACSFIAMYDEAIAKATGQ